MSTGSLSQNCEMYSVLYCWGKPSKNVKVPGHQSCHLHCQQISKQRISKHSESVFQWEQYHKATLTCRCLNMCWILVLGLAVAIGVLFEVFIGLFIVVGFAFVLGMAMLVGAMILSYDFLVGMTSAVYRVFLQHLFHTD